MGWTKVIITLAIVSGVLAVPRTGHSADFIVYSINRAIDMGNPGEAPQKDFYVNMGTANGVREGETLDVIRKMVTYDVVTEKMYREMTFKIATLKITHAESNASIAKLDKISPPDKIPAASLKGIMIGDIVKPAGR